MAFQEQAAPRWELKVRGVLLDIEGTTSSISFVYDVMFPYVRENLTGFLAKHWGREDVQACVPLLHADLKDAGLLSEGQEFESPSMVAGGVTALMDADVKATGLKQLQGLIWKDGFHDGQLVAHLFDEVAAQIRNWHASGIDVRIYSSGSIAAQKLFFGHTIAGDLLPLLNGHYDTTTGPKREQDSYREIASAFACEAGEIVFVSDVVEELQAAQQAGLQTVLSVRPGNQEVPKGHSFKAVTSFDQIEIA